MANLTWRGNVAEQLARKAAMEGLHLGAEVILTDAIDEAPLDTATLRRSGTVTDAPSEGAVYASFNTPYAVRQHEDLTLNHPRGGKAKYLEDPYKRNVAKVQRLVGLEIKNALEGKGD